MSLDRVAELERQTAVALAAVGTSVGETLALSDASVLETLKAKSRGLQASLEESGISHAAMIFGAFVEALCDVESPTKPSSDPGP